MTGVITSSKFAAMEMIDRQNLIGELLERALLPEEQRQIQVIVGVTPDEGDGYLASNAGSMPTKSSRRRRS